MAFAGSLSALSRRAILAVGVAAAMGAGGPAYAQDAAQQDPLKFNRTAPLMVIWSIKPDRVADFEAGWRAIKDTLAKATTPELQGFAQTFEVLKVETPAGAPSIYIFRVDNPSQTVSYNPATLLYDALLKANLLTREAADEIWKKLEGSWTDNGITPWPLQKAF